MYYQAMSLSRILLPVIVLLQLAQPAHAEDAPDLRIVGLFKDRAVFFVEGTRRTLAVGETSPEGVTLLAADSETAVFEVDGRKITGTLDGRVFAGNRKAPAVKEVQIWRNPIGMYTTIGSINGLPVAFLVDTGATQVAMNADQARRLGIDYRVAGTPSTIATASGVERAYAVMLDTVKVGDISLRNVEGVVLEGAQPPQVLLGMSYLGRLEISNDGHQMTLRKKY